MQPRVVIIGAGFGGLYAARALAHAPVDVVVVDRTNHFVFQPLLYQVATAVLAPSDIAVPIRWRLCGQRNTSVVLAAATEIDVERRVVTLDREPRTLSYDYLIVATGSHHSYFGHAEWAREAPGLKGIDDALEIRRRFLLAFERAEWAPTAAERDRQLTIVVVGGGPTGVELAGMIQPASRHTFQHEFRNIDTRSARVVLVEAGPRLLPALPEPLSEQAKRDLEALGVEVRLDTKVTGVDESGVQLGDERVDAATVFWAAGNAASPLGSLLGVPLERGGRIRVAPDLSVPGHPEVFVVGDLALIEQDGRAVPAVAPAAMQQGRAAARNVVHAVLRQEREPFRYVDKGDLATIGRHRAVASFFQGKIQLRGRIAWWFWLLLHIAYLAGFRNRISVMIQWAYAYFTYQRGARLLEGGRGSGIGADPCR
ncbi:MAG: NAD(P)/FAD-dependent oxidoreductase [Gemmatimonadaceae bacterium]|nr:NAD(P)/FAD-dependent oxidoreductase [Gemmatimonadaceae bacterium]NUQ92945.1 NAD(P)/FAD-dependent oxidoreductase [Gemmatimonadaceae bacterium]NUS97145.1 NAD(P)/FAD-dependent oxidoreductase [Gemmatimonadaceae bacterium]